MRRRRPFAAQSDMSAVRASTRLRTSADSSSSSTSSSSSEHGLPDTTHVSSTWNDSAFCELQCSSDWVDSRCDGPLALVHARVQPGVRMQLEHKVAKLIHKLLNKFQVRADQTRINSRLQAPWVTDRREVRSVKHMPCRARNGVKTPRRLSWCGTYRQKLFNTSVRIGASKSYAAVQRSHTKTHRSRQTCRSQVSGHADCRALRPRASVRAAIARQSGHKPTSSIG